MCGIVAILSKDQKRTEDETFSKIENASKIIKNITEATESTTAKGTAFHKELSLSFSELLSFETIFYSGCSKKVSSKLKELSDDLTLIIGRLNTLLSQTICLSKQEELNSLKELILDEKWLIDDDITEAVISLKDLNSGSWSEKDRHSINHLWRIDCCLRNIGRLEVRGRDSAGISIMATFENEESCENFLSKQATDDNLKDAIDKRKENADFRTFAVAGGTWPGFIFAYKVAREIGHIGDNVRKLRKDIASDKLIYSLINCPEVNINIVSHVFN